MAGLLCMVLVDVCVCVCVCTAQLRNRIEDNMF
jgi:hypothetical protein